jgi:hypothetical protein
MEVGKMKNLGSLCGMALLGIAALAPASAYAEPDSNARVVQSRYDVLYKDGLVASLGRRGFTWAEVQAIRALQRML